jgi:hypothetical protein
MQRREAMKQKPTLEVALLLALAIATTGCGGDDDPSPTGPGPDPDPDPVSCVTEVADDVTAPTTWGAACDTIRVLTSIDVDADLTILPRTVIQMADDTDINVDEGGSINAVGSAWYDEEAGESVPDSAIVFEGLNRGKGAWNGIAIESESARNRFEWVTIRDAGGVGFKGHPWVLTIAGSTTSSGLLEMEYCTIEHCDGVGLVIQAGGELRDSYHVTLRDIEEEPVMVAFSTAEDLNNLFYFEDLDMNYVLVTRGTITSVHDWGRLQVPYRIQQDCEIRDPGGLYVGTGTMILFEQDVQFESNGGFIAFQGTPEDPIQLTGAEAIPGYWGGISFESMKTNNVIEHCVIEHAGARVRGNWEFGVFVSGDATTRGIVEIRDTHIREIDGDGIYIRNGGAADMDNVTFEGIAGSNIVDENGNG